MKLFPYAHEFVVYSTCVEVGCTTKATRVIITVDRLGDTAPEIEARCFCDAHAAARMAKHRSARKEGTKDRNRKGTGP